MAAVVNVVCTTSSPASQGRPVRCAKLWFIVHPIFFPYRWFLRIFSQLHTFPLFKTVVVVRCSVVSWLSVNAGRLCFVRPRGYLNMYLSIARWNGFLLTENVPWLAKPQHPWSQPLLAASCVSRLSLNCSQSSSRLSWLSLVSQMKLSVCSVFWWILFLRLFQHCPLKRLEVPLGSLSQLLVFRWSFLLLHNHIDAVSASLHRSINLLLAALVISMALSPTKPLHPTKNQIFHPFCWILH